MLLVELSILSLQNAWHFFVLKMLGGSAMWEGYSGELCESLLSAILVHHTLFLEAGLS